MNRFVMSSLKRPYRPRRFLQGLDQMVRFGYMGLFSIPVLAPLLVRIFIADGLTRMLRVRDGIPADQLHHSDTYRSDAANSLKVYPANYFRTMASARTDHYIDVPVQLIVSSKDPACAAACVRRHRLCRSCGAATSGRTLGAVLAAQGARAIGPRAYRLSRREAAEPFCCARGSAAPRECFGDMLVSVTGAGSGIGPRNGTAFARGAEVVVSDIDEASVKDTAA
jgi:hypothetical protein